MINILYYGHKSTIHVPIGQKKLYEKDMWDFSTSIIDNYDGRLQSIQKLLTSNKYIKRITGGDDLYTSKGAAGNFTWNYSKVKPKNAKILKTDFSKIGKKAGIYYNKSLSYFHAIKKDKNKLKEQELLRNNLGLIEHELVAYTQEGINRLLRCCFDPKTHNGNQVNSIVIPPPNSDINEKICNCLHIKFRKEWNYRKIIENLPINQIDKLAFQINEEYWCVAQIGTKTFEYKHADKIDNFQLSTDHQKSMLKIAEIDNTHKKVGTAKKLNQKKKEIKQRKPSGWNLFRSICASANKSGKVDVCNTIWNSNLMLKKEINKLAMRDIDDKISHGVKILNKYIF